jgi:exopolysaccharide biosynthesis WecB/TagA/CpsF family protein
VADQIAGADLLPAWCQAHGNDPGVRVFLVGGTTPEAAQQAGRRLDELAACPVVCGVFSPPRGFESDAAQLAHIQQLIQDAGATVVAVGVGAPKQELWITRHRALFPNVKLWMAVGATIDFLGGYRRRAPVWMTRVGLEWAYRLVQEPGRLARRYLLDDLPVLGWLLLQRLGLYRNPWSS